MDHGDGRVEMAAGALQRLRDHQPVRAGPGRTAAGHRPGARIDADDGPPGEEPRMRGPRAGEDRQMKSRPGASEPEEQCAQHDGATPFDRPSRRVS